MPDDVRISFLEWLANEDADRQARYVAYREYYDGDHDTQLTARQRKYLQIKIGEEFNDNYCPIVVDALAERLTVTGFNAGKNTDLATQLWDWWKASRMDAVQGVTHLAATRDGDGYILVEWDNDGDRPNWTFEPAYNGTEGVKVHYSKDRRRQVAFASKRWRVEGEDVKRAGKARRLNLYYPDRIEKYVSYDDVYEGAWQPYIEEGQPWPLPWTVGNVPPGQYRDNDHTDPANWEPNESAEPLGVPVVHFQNKDQGYNYGQSELKNVIPLQNALNKAIIDLLATADTTGFPLFYMLGDDPSGLTTAPGSWIYSLRPPSGDESVSVGKIDAEDLSPLIAFKDSIVTEIARVSRTPLSYFQTSGARAAEGTLKQEEVGLVARALDRQVSFGNAWEDCMSLAIRLHNTFGEGGLDEEQQISTQWADPQTRNEKEHLEMLEIKSRLGVPRETLWAEMEYDAEEIATMRAQAGDEMQQTANIGGELLRSFEGGGFGGE